MYTELQEINSRPEPFEYYTAEELWADEHTSQQMLTYHLNESVDISSRKHEFIERSVAWIADRFGVKEGTKIADFGCGPGLYTTRLAELHADVTGIDFSERSIMYARDMAQEKGLAIEYVHKNYLEYTTDQRFDLITMIMCDLCALSPSQRKTLIRKYHTLLKPGGSVLLDAYSLNAFAQREETATYEHNQLNGFWSRENYYSFLNTFKYEKEKVMLDKYTIVEEARTRVVYNWLQYFSPETLRGEFEDSGFAIEEFYSDVAGAPFNPESLEFAIVARKKKLS